MEHIGPEIGVKRTRHAVSVPAMAIEPSILRSTLKFGRVCDYLTPMSISKEQVEYIAKLARLSLTEAEKETYARQLGSILGYIAKLNELDTTNVPPTSHVVHIEHAFRPDQTRPGLTQDEALANAPDPSPPFFRVPKVI